MASDNGSRISSWARSATAPVYWAMSAFRVGLWALLIPVALAGQAPRPTAPPQPPQPPPYRGFTPGLSYRAFLERARVLADGDVVRCQTSTPTAPLLGCALAIP